MNFEKNVQSMKVSSRGEDVNEFEVVFEIQLFLLF